MYVPQMFEGDFAIDKYLEVSIKDIKHLARGRDKSLNLLVTMRRLTRKLLHASHETRYDNVLVQNPDTDVFVLLLHFSLANPGKLYISYCNCNVWHCQKLREEKCR